MMLVTVLFFFFVKAKLINELTIGHKDYEKSIFDIMNEIFFVTNAKK